MAEADTTTDLRETPLAGLHRALGAKLVPFAGYAMPVQYPLGILKEHLWTRASAGLFDVAHMGVAFVDGPSHETTARALETLVPAEIVNLAPGRTRYTQLLADDGGILDDLMVTRPAANDGKLMLVLNASRKEADVAHLAARLPASVHIRPQDDLALLALQGPKAVEALARHAPPAAALSFMATAPIPVAGIDCHVGRSGYTGEDGFEIAVAAEHADRLARTLLAEPEVKPIGLGARDSLRLEAGLCLYGHDIDTTTSPVEAGLTWSIGRRRRIEGGFPGAARVIAEIAAGPARRRVGLRPEGRQPAREGSRIVDASGRDIGVVTSGGFGPTVNGPVAMGYVEPAFAASGAAVALVVRDKALAAAVVELPFVAHRYHR